MATVLSTVLFLNAFVEIPVTLFLCIWYENSEFWVHEVKRLLISFYMALCVPIHLRQRTSHVYQDHQSMPSPNFSRPACP